MIEFLSAQAKKKTIVVSRHKLYFILFPFCFLHLMRVQRVRQSKNVPSKLGLCNVLLVNSENTK